MPGIIALVLASLFGNFIPYHLRVYVYISVILTLLLGLVTGQFHKMTQQQKEEEAKQDNAEPEPEQEETVE